MTDFPEGLATLTSSSDKDVFERVWKIVQECGEEERHFNQLQGVYRGIASTWILATLGAVGYLLFNKDANVHSPFQIYLVAAVICLVGAAGIALIWLLDLVVYHRLLVAVFNEGVKLEKQFDWLPKFRTNMISRDRLGHRRSPIRKKLAIYYVLTMGVPLLAMCQFAGLYCRDLNLHWYRVSVTSSIIAIVSLVFLYFKTTKVVDQGVSRLRGKHLERAKKSTRSFFMSLGADFAFHDMTGLYVSARRGGVVLFSDLLSDSIWVSPIKATQLKWNANEKGFVGNRGEKVSDIFKQLLNDPSQASCDNS